MNLMLYLNEEDIQAIKDYYGQDISDQDVIEVAQNILSRYLYADYFDPELLGAKNG